MHVCVRVLIPLSLSSVTSQFTLTLGRKAPTGNHSTENRRLLFDRHR